MSAKQKKKVNFLFFISLVFLVIALIASLVFLYFNIFKTTTIDGKKLKGKVTKTIMFPEVTKTDLMPGEEVVLLSKIKYVDRKKNEVIISPKDVEMSIYAKNSETKKNVTIISKNSFKVNQDAKENIKLSITLKVHDDKKTYEFITTSYLKSTLNDDKTITNPDDTIALVNKERHLKETFVPKDLVVPNVTTKASGDTRKLKKEAATALEELFKAAKKDNIDLAAVSGYRSYSLQKSIFESNVKRKGSEEKANQTSAKAGESEHQLGLAMDVSTKSVNYTLEENFGTTDAGKWLAKNAYKYGFIIRYPKGKEKITGYSYEPWHIRYIGKEVAKEIYDKKITLEEYFESK